MAWTAATLAASLVAGPAAAQVVVRGTVRADSTAQAIPGALVVVEGRSATADLSGRFTLDSVGSGLVLLQVRAVGFRPLQAHAELGERDTLEIEVRLTPLPHTLAPVTVTAGGPPASGKMLEFERRRAVGFGHFFTRAELAKMETGPLSNVLRLVAGLQFVVPAPACSYYAVATGRSRDTPMPPAMYCGGLPPRNYCYLDIYMDGARFWMFGQSPPPDIDQFAVRDFQGIEIYRGRAELPIEMTRGEPDCGAIVFWTRTGEP